MNPVEKTSGPCVILAGAGTGKTYTIVEKIKHLILSGAHKPEKLVCITFSNEAAGNLLSRVRHALDLTSEPVIMTFHAFAAELLRKFGEVIGVNKEFIILTPDDAKVLLHRTLRVLPQQCHRYVATISTAKDLGIGMIDLKNHLNKLIGGREFADINKRHEDLNFELQTLHLKSGKEKKKSIVNEIKELKTIIDIKKFVAVWDAYEKIKNKQNYLDYSDLQCRGLELLQKNPEIALNYTYTIVDEFQDTNKVQIDFLKALCPSGNITVVGDTNQSIYRFRGAYKDNLQLFKHYFGAKNEDCFTLQNSYRSPNKVLRTAHKLISHNYENKEECFEVFNVYQIEGDNIEVYEMINAKEESRKILELVNQEISKGRRPEDICVMFRTHQQGLMIRRVLEQEGIPFSSVTKTSLLKHPVIKTALDYITIAHFTEKKKSGGEQEWWDLIYQLDFIEEDLIKIGKFIKEIIEKNSEDSKLKKKMEDEGEGLEDKVNLSDLLFNSLTSLPLSASGRMAARLLIERIGLIIKEIGKPVKEFLPEVYKIAGLMPSGQGAGDKEVGLNLNKLIELANSHSSMYSPDVSSFLHYIEVLSNLGIEVDSASLETSGVRLMTLHSTKGLEYPVIILTNMAQKRFPLERYTQNSLLPSELLPELGHINGMGKEEKEDYISGYEKHHQLLEERRLCYVAFTRAREKLIITYALEYGGKKFSPSSFLTELNYLSNPDLIFFKDSQELAKEAEQTINLSKRFSNILQSNNFEELLISAVKAAEKSDVRKNADGKLFSVSALNLFMDCQKHYEYKYVYNMPDKKSVSWEAIRLGNFVHLILD